MWGSAQALPTVGDYRDTPLHRLNPSPGGDGRLERPRSSAERVGHTTATRVTRFAAAVRCLTRGCGVLVVWIPEAVPGTQAEGIEAGSSLVVVVRVAVAATGTWRQFFSADRSHEGTDGEESR